MRSADGETRDIEMLKNAVSLSQLNVGALREGDLLNLKEDLYDLTARGWMGDHKEEFLRRLTVEQIGTIQAKFRHCFESLAKGNKSLSWKIDTPMKLAFAAYSEKVNEPFEYDIMAPDPVHAAGISLVFLLIRSRVTPERFRKCPECGSLFLLLRKPDKRTFYCSQRCAGRVATRNFRRGKPESIKRKMKTIRKPKRAMDLD
jgi:hypothetical protein